MKSRYLRTMGVLVVPLLSAGCSKVAIGSGPYKVVAMEPVGGEIRQYPSQELPVNQGQMLEFQLTSGTSNLRSISNWLGLHHVYFEVCACSPDGKRLPALISGNVHEVPTTDGIEIPRRYRAYVPLDLKQIIRRASTVGTLDVNGQLNQARAHGLCLRVGGGAMWGGTLKSNSVRLPLAFDGDELRVVEPATTGATVPNYPISPSHSAVTALAQGGKRRAAGRAGYRGR